MNFQIVIFCCLFLVGCQPSVRELPDKKFHIKDDKKLLDRVEQQLPDSSSLPGQCHDIKVARQFFRYSSQPKSSYFQFSLEKTSTISEISPKLTAAKLSATQLKDIQKQLEIADVTFKQVLKLRPPLEQPRYSAAKFINVTIEPSVKPFGLTYDEVISNSMPQKTPCFIGMKISSAIEPITNPTPAHELFHVYQNGYMMFKQAWLTEGLARWSESLFRSLLPPKELTTLPQNQKELMAVMDESYSASKMWFRLFELIDDEPLLAVPEIIGNQTYQSGDLVVANNKIYGTEFISILFEELADESLNVSKNKAWPEFNWKEKDQKDKALNPYIWGAIKRAVNKAKPVQQQSEELRQFLSIEL